MKKKSLAYEEDGTITSETESVQTVRKDAMLGLSTFALECHATARGLVRTADGHYHNADETKDKKGLWGAVTGILFGSVTLTEDADAFLHEQEYSGNNNITRRDRSGPVNRAREEERDLLNGNSCRKARAYIRGHYHRKELIRTTLVFGRARELLLASAGNGNGSVGGSSFEALMEALEERTQVMVAKVLRERQLRRRQRQRHSSLARDEGNEEDRFEGDYEKEEEEEEEEEEERDLREKEDGYESISLTTTDEEDSATDTPEKVKYVQNVDEIEAVLLLEWVGTMAELALRKDCTDVVSQAGAEANSTSLSPDPMSSLSARGRWGLLLSFITRLLNNLTSFAKDEESLMRRYRGYDNYLSTSASLVFPYLLERQ